VYKRQNNDACLGTLEMSPATKYTLDSLLIQEFIQITKAEGIDTILLDVPSQLYSGELKSSFSHLQGELPSGTVMCSPMEALEVLRQKQEKLYFEKGHKHFTPAGYDQLAIEAAKCVRSIFHEADNGY